MQKPMIHWLLHSIGDSHVVFVTLSSRTERFSPVLAVQTWTWLTLLIPTWRVSPPSEVEVELYTNQDFVDLTGGEDLEPASRRFSNC